ncbi:TlpA family protein disulfide reductase [Chitinophaga sp. G-6-1-13]|uniref:TlpA family protein disulfide reductase n=1 Tax=Chitinophaga fulva TaxID=2728842 RepID=A0A848GTZ8_9BACT|nr:TlpA disulfide reductase family protein [Chitinophaga fulva]NML40110.1 TlpA family protein disulfide reductase [Chitinophaga fulva]
MKVIHPIIFFFLFTSTAYSQSNINNNKPPTGNGKLTITQLWETRAKPFIGKDYFKLTNADSVFKNAGIEMPEGVCLINLWFADCPPCITEFSDLVKLSEKYADKNFRILSLTFENDSIIDTFRKKYNLPFMPRHVSREACYKLNLQNGFPTNIILNPSGIIAFMSLGGNTNPEKSSLHFEKILVPAIDSVLRHL